MSKLKTKERNKLSGSQFALPKTRAYPIHDENHAKLALAMVSKYGTTGQQRQVKAAVSKRYGIGGSEGATMTSTTLGKDFSGSNHKT